MIKFLGLAPCDESEVAEATKTKHILYLSGKFVDAPDGGMNILARIRMRTTAQRTVGMELTVRSMNLGLSTTIANAMFA
jgi:hypothetical protein